MASQITSLTVYSGADQRKHQILIQHHAGRKMTLYQHEDNVVLTYIIQ